MIRDYAEVKLEVVLPDGQYVSVERTVEIESDTALSSLITMGVGEILDTIIEVLEEDHMRDFLGRSGR